VTKLGTETKAPARQIKAAAAPPMIGFDGKPVEMPKTRRTKKAGDALIQSLGGAIRPGLFVLACDVFAQSPRVIGFAKATMLRIVNLGIIVTLNGALR
jgi:presenilin-like A22 family membrane protease